MGVALFAVVAVIGAFATRGNAQEPPAITLPPLGPTTTTTTTTVPGSSSSDPGTTVPPDGSAPPPSAPADPSQDGDGGSAVGGGPNQIIPPDAQAVLDAMVRSGANDPNGCFERPARNPRTRRTASHGRYR